MNKKQYKKVTVTSGSPQNNKYFEIYYSLGGESDSASTNNTNLLIGRSNSWPDVVFKITDRTFPSWPTLHEVTRANFQSFRWLVSRRITTSPFSKLRFLICHFVRCCNELRNSLRHRIQNSFVTCWILLHCRLQNMSARWKSPGGGRITLDFLVNKLTGAIGIKLLTSDKLSTVRGLELITPSTSTIRVLNPSSVKLVEWVWRSDASMERAVRIWRSYTPPKWLARGGFRFQSVPTICR